MNRILKGKKVMILYMRNILSMGWKIKNVGTDFKKPKIQDIKREIHGLGIRTLSNLLSKLLLFCVHVSLIISQFKKLLDVLNHFGSSCTNQLRTATLFHWTIPCCYAPNFCLPRKSFSCRHFWLEETLLQ